MTEREVSLTTSKIYELFELMLRKRKLEVVKSSHEEYEEIRSQILKEIFGLIMETVEIRIKNLQSQDH